MTAQQAALLAIGKQMSPSHNALMSAKALRSCSRRLHALSKLDPVQGLHSALTRRRPMMCIKVSAALLVWEPAHVSVIKSITRQSRMYVKIVDEVSFRSLHGEGESDGDEKRGARRRSARVRNFDLLQRRVLAPGDLHALFQSCFNSWPPSPALR